ncbi:MAG: maleylpyruvate isomerase N-terminal domain-containing protein [Mangrovicoccus sp.]
MITPEEDARAELRARQGAGARYDAPAAPAAQLAWARRGTAYFARLLNNLSYAQLQEPSRIPGWSRAHLVAHISYNARAIARLCETVRMGEDLVFYPSRDEREAEIQLAATLPDRALRHLFEHAVVHLNVEWRDLSNQHWTMSGTGLDGNSLALAATPWIRARELWVHALDLNAGGRIKDFPSDFRDQLALDLPNMDRLTSGCRPLGSETPADLPEDWPY